MARKHLIRLTVILVGTAAVGIWVLALRHWRTEDDIREAVFRYQMRHNLSSGEQQVYYLSAGALGCDRSPSNALLRRFGKQKPAVRPVWQCSAGADGVRDKRTGETGVILYAGPVKWLSSHEVEVKSGYFEHGLSASDNVYRVAKRKGRWIVIRDKLILVA